MRALSSVKGDEDGAKGEGDEKAIQKEYPFSSFADGLGVGREKKKKVSAHRREKRRQSPPKSNGRQRKKKHTHMWCGVGQKYISIYF